VAVEQHDRRSFATATEEHARISERQRLLGETLEHITTVSKRRSPRQELTYLRGPSGILVMLAQDLTP
jgi:hypothetical protein